MGTLIKITSSDDSDNKGWIDPEEVSAVRHRTGQTPIVHLRGGHSIAASLFAENVEALIILINERRRGTR